MKFLPIIACLLAVSCAGPREALIVKQFTLRDQNTDEGSEPMVRQEKLRRLYGAVSLEERKGRLGQYYTALWSAPESVGQDRSIILYYQQGGSGSLIKTMRRDLPRSSTEGKEEFAVIGNDYFDNGRVLTWKMDLVVGGQTIASKQSYLWE